MRAAVRDDRWTIIVAAALLAAAFFVLPTRVHERYIFPVVALLPLLAVVARRWALALLLLSAGAFINLHGILTLPLYGTPNVETLAAGEWFRTQPLIVSSAVLQTLVAVWMAWQLRPSLQTSPDAFDRVAAARSGPLVTDAARDALVRRRHAAATGASLGVGCNESHRSPGGAPVLGFAAARP